MPSKKYVLKLTSEEREILAKVIRESRAPGWKTLRARALLKCDQGPQGPAWSDSRIAEALECTVNSLENWRKHWPAHQRRLAITAGRCGCWPSIW